VRLPLTVASVPTATGQRRSRLRPVPPEGSGRHRDSLAFRPPFEFAKRDQPPSSAVDDSYLGENVAFEVVAADAKGAGCFVDAERDSRYHARRLS
jgi:hypothetical protein